jgi:hypothetical protein
MDQAEFFGGVPGEPVAQVDPEDVRAVWKLGLGRSMESGHSGGQRAIGVEVCRAACKPGADISAVCYRGMMLGLVTRHAQEQLAPWVSQGEMDDAIFRAIAEVPMEWMGVGITRHGPPFDFEDFMRRVREAAEDPQSPGS